jgi:2-polyprenyl-6-methoxyphenol hydroxylase-like FAD-dependent oxidoreductase
MRVLVIGGGIGGLTATLALRREGFQVDVLASILVRASWHRGRVVLLGDAAHGTTPHCGKGAAQAIEDGIVLAQELGRDENVEAALRSYGAGCRPGTDLTSG